MKLGAENRKEVIALAVLGVLALYMAARAFWPSAPETTTAAPAAPAASANRVTTRRTASGKAVKLTDSRLDPTLQLDLLSRSEDTKYQGTGRNIFVDGPEPIPTPLAPGVTDQKKAQYAPPPIAPPPPITLKFFGFASKPGQPKRVFLSQGDDVFIAGEGDIVDRRYRVLRISPLAVDIEDLLHNNRQSIPLTQG